MNNPPCFLPIPSSPSPPSSILNPPPSSIDPPSSSLSPKSSLPPSSSSFAHSSYLQAKNLADDPSTRKEFWSSYSEANIFWHVPPKTILSEERPPFYRWFPDGKISVCYNAVDRWALSQGEKLALVYESAMINKSETYTYSSLLNHVSRFASVLLSLGVSLGDRVIIYMPMIPEAVFAMLACSRIGAIHSVVFGGFSAKELAGRIVDADPKIIVSASCGLEPNKVVDYKTILDEALVISNKPILRSIIVQRDTFRTPKIRNGLDFDYHTLMASFGSFNGKFKGTFNGMANGSIDCTFDGTFNGTFNGTVDCVPVNGDHPLYILYTSGTTGQPKGIVRDSGGTAVALHWTMKHIMGIEKGDVYFSSSDIGWVVGHSFIVYGPLLSGATTILYEGKPVGTPDPGTIWRIIEKYKVKGFYTAPTALRVLRKEDPQGKWIKKSDTSSLKAVSFAGERCDIPTFDWISENLPGVLINDNYWQTETGWIISCNYANLTTFPSKAGSCTKPGPGFVVSIMNEENKPVKSEELGRLCIKLPLPPSFMLTLWNNDQAFVRKYLSDVPGYYVSGDAGYFDSEGYLHVMTRLDDIINTAGHRLSTAAMEEVLLSHPLIVEAAVVSVKDDLRGEIPFGFVVLKSHCKVKDTSNPGSEDASISNESASNGKGSSNNANEPALGFVGEAKEKQVEAGWEINAPVMTRKYSKRNIEKELVDLVRKDIGPVACFKNVIVLEKLPKTRSGKILRGTLKKILDRKEYTIPATIEDESILLIIEKKVKEYGLGESGIIYEEDMEGSPLGRKLKEDEAKFTEDFEL